MIYALIAVALIAHLFLPPALFYWILRSRARNRAHWFSLVTLTGGFLVVMYFGGAAWSWFGRFWPILFLTLFPLVSLRSWKWRKHFPLFPEKKLWPWTCFLLMVSAAVLILSGIPHLLTARAYPKEKAVRLVFPLKGGSFHIGQGGNNETFNHHFTVPAQKYAIDIVALNKLGIRANGLLPADLGKYTVFGREVHAPCSGEVISSQNDLPDMTPPSMDSDHIMGNHVVLYCDGVSVLLAHLKGRSLKVTPGEQVERGSVVGEVGNSGNTSEPHLHIHTVSGRHSTVEEVAGTAEGLPMLFEGRFLIRNDVLRVP